MRIEFDRCRRRLGGVAQSVAGDKQKLGASVLDRLGANLGTHGKTFGTHKGYVRDADKAEQRNEVRLLTVHRLRRSVAVKSAAALHHDSPLARQQSFGASLRIAEGGSGGAKKVIQALRVGTDARNCTSARR